ncbi:MAG: hypothetical protein H7Y38_04140 [Armatimonadetes bacterium]|nr:hypothetical protein [Armatimonadota bacterium]
MNRIALVAITVLIAAPLGTVYAQTPAPPAKPAKPAPRPAPSLDFLRHDPATQGVLLLIPGGNERGIPTNTTRRIVTRSGDGVTVTDAPEATEPPKRTPAQYAEAIKRRVAISGNLSAIVPLTMAVLAKNPPPADPYSDMAFDERFLMMLSKLSRAQWVQATSENGIGLGDMTPEQREIYAGLWGEDGATVTTNRTAPRKEGQRYRETTELKKETFNANEVRFRFSRRVSFTFEDAARKRKYGGGTVGYESPAEPEADGSTLKQYFNQPGGYRRFTEEGEAKAYGITLMRYVPNTLKPGDLSLDAPALAAPVMLDGTQKTVGELLAAASKATGIELRADRRLLSLPALMKTVSGGQSVKAGDLLKLICRSTTSTFRHLRGANAADPGLYLLTDDREGLGTRLARLDEWAKDAYEKRRKILQDATDACAENEPLDVLGFMPGDKYALSPDLLKASDDVLREKGGYSEGLKISPAKLSPELREKMDEQVKGLNEYGSSAKVRTDQIEVKTDFHCDWVLPGKRVFKAQFYGEMGWGMLDKIALPKARRPKYVDREKRDHPEPSGFPKNLKRRVLVAPLPADDAGTLALMQSARAKGFNEIWLRVEGDNEEVRTRLSSAVTNGRTVPLAVGAVLPWTLKMPEGEGANAEEDINILGETGAQVWAVQEKRPTTADETDAAPRDYRNAAMREQKAQTAGWIVPDAALAARRIAPFLGIPGLSGVVLESTAPPGYTGARYSFSYEGETAMGYTNATRLGCVRAMNIDPVDVAGYGFRLGNTPRLPFFSDSYGVMAPVADFRLGQNKAFMAGLWEALRPTPTGTPIYLDNRNAGGYSQYPFYARWSDPKKVPNVPENAYEEAPVRTAAFKASTEPLLSSRGIPWYSSGGYYWDKWYKDTRSAASQWRGFVVDLRYQSPEQIADFLKQLPDDAAPAAPIKSAGVPKKP